jgi:N-acetylgalactosamine kinase
MADNEDYDDGVGGGGYAEDEVNVDESQLKLPQFKWESGQEVKSGEDDEEATYKQRCKLFRLHDKEWKERGTGDIKLLKHKVTGKFRIVMRQEKTLKVCANQSVDPNIELKVNAGNDRSWVWTGLDIADGEPTSMTFAVRFKDAETANEFKSSYDEARKANAALVGISTGRPAAPSSAPAPAAASHEDKSGPIPKTENLEIIYGIDASVEASSRYTKIVESFKAAFDGSEPTFFVRAPGRVNLIGEHIDYHGYSVLPMALQQDTVIAVHVGQPHGPVRVTNTNSKYGMASLPSNPALPIDQSEGVKWFQYVQCGYKGAFDVASQKGMKLEPVGLSLMIDGRVPAGAGVSSSSALVVSSLLAVAEANGIAKHMTRAELGEGGRACELYIGTMSGGMDQAISSMANSGSAARIDFEPLKATAVQLPQGAAFVVSNCLEESVKAVDSEKRYNRRVTEGKLAVKLVAKGLGREDWKSIQTFRQLQELQGYKSPGDILPHIQQFLKPEAYSLEHVKAQAGFDPESLFEGDGKRAGALKVIASLDRNSAELELQKRARHVCSEAERVFAFQAACEGKHLDGARIEGGIEAQLKAMGQLMTESHTSCRDDYECSSPGLNQLTELALLNGAYGSRLTGAGWGGCAVSLVNNTKVDSFISALKEGYYVKKGLESHVATALFFSQPGSGAAIFNMPTSFEI